MKQKMNRQKHEKPHKTQIIKNELQQFEKEYNIKIISARDTGSRSWNLESLDSDHDVSFIYIQDHEDYITPTGYKQNIDRESQTEHDIDYNSWNLDRYLALLKQSNPSAIEFLQSNIIYYQPKNQYTKYMQNLEKHTKNNFKPLALMMHHHSLAKNQYERYIANAKDHTYKRHLYAIRSLLYREYIQETKQLPDMNFPKFFQKNQDHFGSWRNYQREIQNMINNKQKGYGNKTIRTRKLAKKINKDLKKDIPDNKKPEYTKQNIQTETLNKETKPLIKEINQKPNCTWKQWIKSILKAHTHN